MNGILEQVLAELQGIRAQLGQMASVSTAMGAGSAQVQPVVAVTGAQPIAQQPPQQQFVPQPQPQTASNVTAEAITALIQPHIGNEAIKAALGAAMRGMGINALPETQPHQFGALYQAFQNVIAQHTMAQQQPAPQAGMSII